MEVLIAQLVNFKVNATLRQFGKYRMNSGEISSHKAGG